MKLRGTAQFPEVMSTAPVLANQSKTLVQSLAAPTYDATSGGKRRT